MRFRRSCVLAALSTVALWASILARLEAQPIAPYTVAPPSTQYAPAIAEGRNAIRKLISAQQAPGFTIAVMVNGKIVWSEGLGLADLENRVPVWPHTKMRIGSVSKSLTSAAIALLYEQGKLDLDAPIHRYVPSFPKKRYPITARQLAGHLAGVRHYGDPPGNRQAEFFNMRPYDSVLEELEIFQDDPLLFKPGEKFHYSSYAWNLLSAVVEGASGQDFLTYMQTNVFEPLGMRSTVADQSSRIIMNRTRFYQRDETGEWRNAPYVDNSYKWAGGGFLSTAEDLLRFGQGITAGELLKPETVKLLFASQRTNDGNETNYGMGWRLGTDEKGRRWVGHGGSSVGGSSRLLIYPSEQVILAVIANSSVEYRDVDQQIAGPFINKSGSL